MMHTLLAVVMAAMMTCSFYGEDFHGRETASGEVYNMHDLTAASPHLPFGTKLLLRKGDNSVIVTINDRGPFDFRALAQGRLEPHPTRDIDLSKAAFAELAPLSKGIIEVTAREIKSPPPLWVPPPGVDWEEDQQWR